MYPQGLLSATFYAAAALLLAAGVVKLRRPEPTAEALAGGLPGRHLLVRALGLVEVGIGAGCFVRPGFLAPALALLYASFAVFVGHVLARGLPLRSCGCLGETETEPSRAHVAVTVTAALAGALAALVVPPTPAELLGDTPVAGALFFVTVATACYLAFLVLVSLPDAFGAYRQQVRDP